jgi:hypothetical protein
MLVAVGFRNRRIRFVTADTPHRPRSAGSMWESSNPQTSQPPDCLSPQSDPSFSNRRQPWTPIAVAPSRLAGSPAISPTRTTPTRPANITGGWRAPHGAREPLLRGPAGSNGRHIVGPARDARSRRRDRVRGAVPSRWSEPRAGSLNTRRGARWPPADRPVLRRRPPQTRRALDRDRGHSPASRGATRRSSSHRRHDRWAEPPRRSHACRPPSSADHGRRHNGTRRAVRVVRRSRCRRVDRRLLRRQGPRASPRRAVPGAPGRDEGHGVRPRPRRVDAQRRRDAVRPAAR